MKQVWLRKQFIDTLISGVVGEDLTVELVAARLHAFILHSAWNTLSEAERGLLYSTIRGTLDLVRAGTLSKEDGAHYILRLANLSAAGEKPRF